MIEEQDINRLEEILDGRYVKIEDCNRDDTLVRLAVIEQQQKLNNWLTAAIASGIIALVVKVFIGG